MSLLSPKLANSKITRVRKQLEQELGTLKSELASLPEGKLYITNSRKWPVFYMRANGQTHGITKNKKLIYQLARRHYITLLICFIEDLLEDLCCDITAHSFMRLLADIDSLFDKFEKGNLDIDRITMTANQYIWNSDRHSKKPTRREELIYPTAGRVFMRTKSEQMLGNLLEKLHIPYRYESPLRINNITYHPDFIIMLPNDRLIIIEHVGRLDLQDYDESLVYRLQAYDQIKLFIGRDVFFTFENDTRDEILTKEILFQAFVSTPSDNRYLKSIAARAGCRFEAQR